jgi:hypothetical protein
MLPLPVVGWALKLRYLGSRARNAVCCIEFVSIWQQSTARIQWLFALEANQVSQVTGATLLDRSLCVRNALPASSSQCLGHKGLTELKLNCRTQPSPGAELTINRCAWSKA